MNELALIDAVKAENMILVKDLIQSGTDVNQLDEQGWTPLNWAAGKGNLAIVRLLVENGSDVCKVGRDQRTPYMIALAAGRVEVARFLREAEDKIPGEKPRRPERIYCRAYYLRDLRQFSGWTESKVNWKEDGDNFGVEGEKNKEQLLSDDAIVFIHQDHTVTQSTWRNENVIYAQVTPEWKGFCAETLKFKAPDDLDLIVSGNLATQEASSSEA